MMTISNVIAASTIVVAIGGNLSAQDESNGSGTFNPKHLDDLENHRPFRDFQYEIARPDGSTQHIRINGKPIFNDGGVFNEEPFLTVKDSIGKSWEIEMQAKRD